MKQMGPFLKLLWLPLSTLLFSLSLNLKYDLVGFSFFLSSIQAIFFLIYLFFDSKFKGLLTIFYIFHLVFLCLAPWVHYSDSLNIWRSEQIPESTYLITNILVITGGLVVFLSYLYRPKYQITPSFAPAYLTNKPPKKLALLTLSASSFLLLFYLNDFSILQILFRGVIDEARSQVVETSSVALILGMTSRLIPVFCFLYAATEMRSSLLTKITLFIIMALSVFPTGVARFLVAFAYIPIMLIYLPKIRNTSVFSGVLLGALLFIFPFLDQFRYFSGFENLRLLPTPDFFYAAHFDAFENFASAVDSEYISYGLQLLGVLFFYIPRTFWPDKPVGSGYEMAENLNYSFNNISMPLLGEGFVNFGIPGVLVFSLLIGLLIGKLDRAFSKPIRNEPINFLTAIYFYLLGALFFILRGDLLSSTAYVTAGLFSALLVRLLCKPRKAAFR